MPNILCGGRGICWFGAVVSEEFFAFDEEGDDDGEADDEAVCDDGGVEEPFFTVLHGEQ